MLPELTEIERKRRTLGLTQAELARRTNLSRSLIAKVETSRTMPSYEKAKIIFDELDTVEKKAGIGLHNLTLGQICSREVEYAESDETIGEVWKRMEVKTFSQLPVRRDNQIIGSVTERTINRAIIEGNPTDKAGLTLSMIMEETFPMLPAETPIATVIGLLQHYQAVLVQEHGEVTGIATNTDVGRIFNLIK
jgi:predicted transcriptional regulator